MNTYVKYGNAVELDLALKLSLRGALAHAVRCDAPWCRLDVTDVFGDECVLRWSMYAGVDI